MHDMTLSRHWFVGSLCLTIAVFAVLVGGVWLNAADGPATPPGALNGEQLSGMLGAMGLKVTQVESRYDFAFKAKHNSDEWDLSMTAVMSKDGKSIWVMAWLDELPRSTAEVPRTALLRLLADNDRLGHGKFFAYVSSNRRFVMERVISNRGVTPSIMRDVLKDLGRSVVETYPHWSTKNWAASQQVEASRSSEALPANASRSAGNDSKFNPPTNRN